MENGSFMVIAGECYNTDPYPLSVWTQKLLHSYNVKEGGGGMRCVGDNILVHHPLNLCSVEVGQLDKHV